MAMMNQPMSAMLFPLRTRQCRQRNITSHSTSTARWMVRCGDGQHAACNCNMIQL